MSAGRIVIRALLVFSLGLLVGTKVERSSRPDRPLPDCICGHRSESHEHYRRGLDCGECGPDVCDRYVATTPWEQREHERAMGYAERWSPAVSSVRVLDAQYAQNRARRDGAAFRARADAARGRVPLH